MALESTTTPGKLATRDEETLVETVFKLGLALVAGGVASLAAYAVSWLVTRGACPCVGVLWPEDISLEFRCQRRFGHGGMHKENDIAWNDDGEVTVDV